MLKIINDSADIVKYLPIFGTKEFLETKSNEYGWVVSKEFILAYYIDRRFIFSKLVFTTKIINIASVGIKGGDFLDLVIDKCRDLNVDYISQPLANVFFENVPGQSKYITWGSYIVDLSLSEDSILANIHSKHKNVIKKAIKNSVVVMKTNDVNLIFNSIKETMQRQSRSFPSILELEKIKDFCIFFIAKKGDIIQGCSVLAYNSHGAYYLYGGSIPRPYSGSLNYMHYYAMLEFKKNGVERYDFMGARLNVEKDSKLEGIQRFKSRFGGILHTGSTWKYEYRPYKILLMQFIQKILFRVNREVYMGDAIDQESKRNAK
jgi:hypothetical protein